MSRLIIPYGLTVQEGIDKREVKDVNPDDFVSVYLYYPNKEFTFFWLQPFVLPRNAKIEVGRNYDYTKLIPISELSFDNEQIYPLPSNDCRQVFIVYKANMIKPSLKSMIMTKSFEVDIEEGQIIEVTTENDLKIRISL